MPVDSGAQVGGTLQKTAALGRVVFNLPLHAPYWYFLPRDRAFGALFSNDKGTQYSVMAQAPVPNPLRVGAPKGGLTHLDEYTDRGDLDTTFGDNGTTVTPLGSEHVANGVALTPDGHIVVAGYTLGAHVNRDFMLARYTDRGGLDSAFGDHGFVTTDVLGGDD